MTTPFTRYPLGRHRKDPWKIRTRVASASVRGAIVLLAAVTALENLPTTESSSDDERRLGSAGFSRRVRMIDRRASDAQPHK